VGMTDAAHTGSARAAGAGGHGVTGRSDDGAAADAEPLSGAGPDHRPEPTHDGDPGRAVGVTHHTTAASTAARTTTDGWGAAADADPAGAADVHAADPDSADPDSAGPDAADLDAAQGFGAWRATIARTAAGGSSGPAWPGPPEPPPRTAGHDQDSESAGFGRAEPAAASASRSPLPSPAASAAARATPPPREASDRDARGRAADASAAAGRDALDLLDSLAEVVFRTDAEGSWTYLNPAWTRLTGFTVAESLGNAFISYVHPEEIEHTIALFTAVVVGGADHCHHETRYRIADGSYLRVQIRARVLRDDAGEVVGNMGTIIDVTESRLGAEMAGEQGALLELVPTGGNIDDLPVGVVIYDPDLTVRRASRVVDRLVGASTQAGDPVDVLSRQLLPASRGGPALGGEWGLVATARRTRQAQIGDLDVRNARGSGAGHDIPAGRAGGNGRAEDAPAGPVRSLRATVIPLHDDTGTRVAVVFSDITDLRRAERQQAALAYLGQRALTTLDVPALLDEAVDLVAVTLKADRCDLVECLEVATPAGRQAHRGAFDDVGDQVVAGVGGSVVTRADVGPGADDHAGVGVHAQVRACYGRRGDSWALATPVSAAPGSFVFKVLSSRQPVVVDDLAGHADIVAEPWLQGGGAVATVGAPIGVGSRAFGVLAAHSGTRRWFTKDEAHFVQSVANIVAAAVELAQMQEDRARLAVFEDRDRIACELHDLVIQRLFSVGLRLQSLIRLVAEPGTGRLTAAIADLDQTIDEVRRTIFDLRPPY